MKIAILTNADIGLYKFRRELIEDLCRDNEVYILLPDGDFISKLTELGCRFIKFEFNRRGLNPVADIRQFLRYRQLLKELKPDIVLTYTVKPNVYGGAACKSLGIPYISNITGLGTAIQNGGLLSIITTILYRKGLKKASCVFFQNKSNEKLFMDKGIIRGKSRIIPGSGVNLDFYSYEPYPSDEEGIRFLFVGRIMKDKGIYELSDAFKQIQSDKKGVFLDIVGWSDENNSAVFNCFGNGVKFHGLQSDVRPFYRDCHCAVLPSYHEGTANVMLEASATGRPVITTRVPGCQETFDEGITGFGCEAGNAESLIEAMKKFLSLTQDQRKSMGLAARTKMEKEYDRNIVLNAYKEEIQYTIRKENMNL